MQRFKLILKFETMAFKIQILLNWLFRNRFAIVVGEIGENSLRRDGSGGGKICCPVPGASIGVLANGS